MARRVAFLLFERFQLLEAAGPISAFEIAARIPAKAVERLRADAARAQLESGAHSVQAVAARCGFDNPERMRRAFRRLLAAPPSAPRRAQRCVIGGSLSFTFSTHT